jgi:hypothetical protein
MFFIASTDGSTVNLHLQEILAAMQNIERQIQPIAIVIGFVLLVFGTMRGFLEADSRKFMFNLLRATIIVCLIGQWFQVKQWLGYAADALTQYQVVVDLAAFGQGSQRVSVTENVDQIRSIITEKVTANTDGKNQLTGWDVFNPIQAAQKLFNANVSHLLSAVLWHIYMGTLFICEWIVVMMNFLQQAIVVFLDLYVPIALAEFSVRGLQNQGEAFFKTYIGVHAWPVGWVFANLVTLALLQALAAAAFGQSSRNTGCGRLVGTDFALGDHWPCGRALLRSESCGPRWCRTADVCWSNDCRGRRDNRGDLWGGAPVRGKTIA